MLVVYMFFGFLDLLLLTSARCSLLGSELWVSASAIPPTQKMAAEGTSERMTEGIGQEAFGTRPRVLGKG